MRYDWLRDRQAQEEFDFYWMKGKHNDGDYWTKHHPTNYHRQTRNRYIKDYIQHLSKIHHMRENFTLP